MKPGGQRRKGHSWERAVAAMLRPIYGDKVQRGFQTRGGGKEAPDVDGTPFHLECKHGRLVNLRAAMAQAVRDTDGRVPVVVAKDNRTEPLVVMRLDDWLNLVRQAQPPKTEDACVRGFHAFAMEGPCFACGEPWPGGDVCKGDQ